MNQNADITGKRLESEPTVQENCQDSSPNLNVDSPLSAFQRRRVPNGRNSNARGVVANHLLTVEEVALLLNVPRKWVYRRLGLKPPNSIPHLKVGKYVRFKESDIWDYVERLRRNW